jgi:uroporphyrinogen decarboxylase
VLCFLCLQADAGAQVVQIFDSWASHLSPQDFDVFSGPYIKKVCCQMVLFSCCLLISLAVT